MTLSQDPRPAEARPRGRCAALHDTPRPPDAKLGPSASSEILRIFMNPRSHRRPRPAPALAAVAACGLLLVLNAVRPTQPRPADVLAADGALRWYRGNIHTHTLWSDGDDYPEMVALWYKEHGYQFLCFTDHNTLLKRQRWIDPLESKGKQQALDKLRARFPDGWIEQRTSEAGVLEVRLKTIDEIAQRLAKPGEFLLIQGEEISDRFGKLPVHMN